ncbi:hypothetical protein L1049_004664 [Liquidambar formosana]|uniref:Uncharacterized protein n=1 Tax=Liquidambar formosana TaxID=63359 RepID=A0AAP0RNJ4_LIQFO
MFQTKMKKSPIHPKYELANFNGYVFDPQVDFSQFLEEARQHAREGDLKVPSPNREEAGERSSGEEKKSKRSWKNSLFSWWKADKKTKPHVEPAIITQISNSRRGHVSGPIYGSGGGVIGRHRRPTSGPLTSLFNPTKRAENEMPYMCLDKLNNSHVVEAYGPVYLVT